MTSSALESTHDARYNYLRAELLMKREGEGEGELIFISGMWLRTIPTRVRASSAYGFSRLRGEQPLPGRLMEFV